MDYKDNILIIFIKDNMSYFKKYLLVVLLLSFSTSVIAAPVEETRNTSEATYDSEVVSGKRKLYPIVKDKVLADGIGTSADGAAPQGSTGSISAKLRTVTAQLNTLAGYLDGVESVLNTIDTDTGNIADGIGASACNTTIASGGTTALERPLSFNIRAGLRESWDDGRGMILRPSERGVLRMLKVPTDALTMSGYLYVIEGQAEV